MASSHTTIGSIIGYKTVTNEDGTTSYSLDSPVLLARVSMFVLGYVLTDKVKAVRDFFTKMFKKK